MSIKFIHFTSKFFRLTFNLFFCSGHMESVTDCCFLSSVTNNHFFATCSKDGSVCLWQENKFHPTSQNHLDVGPLTTIAMLSNDVLLSGSFSRGIRTVKRSINEQLSHEH